MTRGIVLYGAPATGKDTVTNALSDAFVMVPRLKYGPGRTTGYRMITNADLDVLRSKPDEVLWETQRYSAHYMLTRSDVLSVAESSIPVVHVGQSSAVTAVTSGVPELSWLVVELQCPRGVAAERIAARGTDDDFERLTRWDETPRLDAADLVVDTSVMTPAKAAQQITRSIAPPVVVPAPTFQTEIGTLDSATNARYASAFAESWIPYVLVNGPMGQGEFLDSAQRSTNLDVWLRYVSPDRVIVACWTPEDLRAARRQDAQPLVVLRDEAGGLAGQLNGLPPEVWVYANPRYSSCAVTPEQAAEQQLAGVKLSKVSLDDLQAMRNANPGAVVLHGSSRNIQGSLDAGANLVTAPPLAATSGILPEPTVRAVQQRVDGLQQELDALPDHYARVAEITTRARREPTVSDTPGDSLPHM